VAHFDILRGSRARRRHLLLTRNNGRLVLGSALLGLAITAVIVTYLVLTDSSPPPSPNLALAGVFFILCPPSLLTIPFIDAETGTGGFYFIWFFVALLNSALYAGVGAALARRTLRG
jgi:hypothetical protein